MALTTHYISIKNILSRVLMNPLMEGLNEADAIKYLADCINLIGAPMSYENKIAQYEIQEHRASLPLDLIYIQQTRKVDNNCVYPMRYNSDTFNSKYHEIGSPDFVELSSNYDWSYSINNGCIYTNFKEGNVQQSYKGLKLDDDGLPMVPDDVKFEKAVEWYIKLQHYTILWELNKISDKVFENTKQESCWYIGAANTKAQSQNIDQAESFKNTFTKLLRNDTAGAKSFNDFGRQEYIKTNRI